MNSLLDILAAILVLGSVVAVGTSFVLVITLFRERKKMRLDRSRPLQAQQSIRQEYSPEEIADLVARLQRETLRRQNEVAQDSFGEILIALSSTHPEYKNIEEPPPMIQFPELLSRTLPKPKTHEKHITHYGT